LLDERSDQIAFREPVCILKIVFDFDRKIFQAGDDLLQFSLLSLFINLLFGLGFKIVQALAETLDPGFEFLLFEVTFGVTVNQTRNRFASAGNLGSEYLQALLLAIWCA